MIKEYNEYRGHYDYDGKFTTFCIRDCVTQAEAIRKVLETIPDESKMDWFTICPNSSMHPIGGRPDGGDD